MAELSLLTEDKIVQKGKYVSVKPKGGVIDAISDKRIKAKWIEIFCDLASPKKRDDFNKIPHWDIIVKAWQPYLQQNWVRWKRRQETTISDFWNNNIIPLNILPDLGQAPESTRPLYETWLWSEHNRKNMFLIYNNDADDLDIKIMGSKQFRVYKGKKYSCMSAVFDYESDPTISNATLDNINDKNIAVNPKYSKPVAMAKFTEPDLSQITVSEVIV
jgi:hypothetical protein